MKLIMQFLKALWAPFAQPALELLADMLGHAVTMLISALNNLVAMFRAKFQMA